MTRIFALVTLLILASFCAAKVEVTLQDTLNPPNGATLEATEGINIRAEPCTNGRLITTIPAGTRVTFTGRANTACGYKWYSVRGGFGEHWAASNWLRVVDNSNLVYGPGLPGVDTVLIAKLADLARLVGSRVRVHSGCRPGDRGWHGKCKAADFHVDGQSDINVYRKALASRRIFDRFQFIYHRPGSRACSSGEHNHLARPDNYAINSFCDEHTCNWAKECSNIRLGFSEQVAFDQWNKNCTQEQAPQPECWNVKEN